MDDSFLIRCTKCKGSFRDKVRRVQNGYSRQCPLCERVLFFQEGTPDKNVQKALIDARQLRKALLGVTLEDLQRVARRYVQPELRVRSVVAPFAKAEAVQQLGLNATSL